MCACFYVAHMCAVCSNPVERERASLSEHSNNKISRKNFQKKFLLYTYGSVQEIYVGHEPPPTTNHQHLAINSQFQPSKNVEIRLFCIILDQNTIKIEHRKSNLNMLNFEAMLRSDFRCSILIILVWIWKWCTIAPLRALEAPRHTNSRTTRF